MIIVSQYSNVCIHYYKQWSILTLAVQPHSQLTTYQPVILLVAMTILVNYIDSSSMYLAIHWNYTHHSISVFMPHHKWPVTISVAVLTLASYVVHKQQCILTIASHLAN